MAGVKVGVVPTMGALHDGHISLVAAAEKVCECVVVTIFVNPTQFAPDEDLDKYPRTFQADLDRLSEHQVEFVFAPQNQAMYPEGFSTMIRPPVVGQTLEGESRPEHYEGVTTVVLKLLNIVLAEFAFFGQKHFQQAAVIKRMAVDLDLATEMVVCPIVREKDRLAMSSRNVYLSATEREIALSLFRSLCKAESMIRQGVRDAQQIMTAMRDELLGSGVTQVDYAVVAKVETLEVMDQVELPAVLLVAAKVGQTRLIDNLIAE